MGQSTELRKALETTGNGANLLPYDLDPVLHEELLKQQPLAEILPIEQAKGLTHEYRLRTAHPQGWFEGETTGANNQNNTYAVKSVKMKIARIWGSVTGFAQAMDEAFVDALATELEGSVEGMSNVFEYGIMWGAADDIGFTGDAYQFTGLIPRILKDASANVIDAGGDKVTLDDLDQAVAKASAFRGLRADPALWMMGTRMRQVVDGLQTRVQIPLTSVELADGKIEMAAYDRKPIWETDYLVPASVTTSPTAGGTIGSGGSLPAATYTYKISSITMTGEQVAGTASGNITSAASNNTANLTWTADANAKAYMIWREVGASGAFYLLDIINAKTYNGDGSIAGNRTTYADDGSKTISAVIKPLAAGEQNILLLNRAPSRGVSFLGKVDDMGRPVNSLLSFVELARIKDTYDYMLKSYLSAKIVYPNVHAIVRHVKTA